MKVLQGSAPAALALLAVALAGCGNPAAPSAAPAPAAAASPPPAAAAPPAQAPPAPLAIAPPTQGPAPGMDMAGPAQGQPPGAMQAPAEGLAYCGVIRNTTAGVQDAVAIAFDGGGGFSGRMLLGPSLNGGGHFNGTVAGGVCSATTEGGVTFYGPCPANGQFNASYTIQGQEGVMRLTTAACPP